MKYDHLLVRYGELTLKGSNRKKFVNQLRNNVNKSLKGLDGFVVKGKRDRMYIELEDHADINEITYRLSKIFGIKSISPVLKVEKTIDAMSAAAIKFAQQFEEKTAHLKLMLSVPIKISQWIRMNYSVNWVVQY